jgi:tetratricopeptide (TPR) repeat protein
VNHLNRALPKMRHRARFPNDAPAPESLRVALFKERADFGKFLNARKAPVTESFTLVDGETPARRTLAAFVLDARTLLARLRHVGFAALLRAWFRQPPPWLDEGLGECMEDLAWDEQGACSLGPARGHLRDLREKVMEARPSRLIPLKELLQLDRAAWEQRGLAAYAGSWAFARFLLEDRSAREARLLQKVLARLSPPGAEAENMRRALTAFPEEEWYALEAAFLDYVKKLPETPGEELYRQAREKLAAGEHEAARKLLDAALTADPDYERLYYFRAVALYSLNRSAEAARDLDRALALFPEYDAARFLRGRCRAAVKDAPGARADFEACFGTAYDERAKKELQALAR